MNKVLLEVADIDKETIVGLWYLPDNVLTPYVTWISKKDDYEKTYWGHYFQTREEAEEDFDKRSFRGEAGLYFVAETLGGDYLELLKEFRGF